MNSFHTQKGATLTEFLVVTPLVALLGMIGLQYTLMYNAKTNLSYASYEAARSGAIHHADPEKIQDGLLKGLLPYFGANGDAKALSGNIGDTATVKASILKLKATEAPFMKVEIISPSQAAFDDFNDMTLQTMLKTNNKVIPNKYSDTIKNTAVGKQSGITIAEANVLKLRVTYGYEPKIPLAKNMFVSVASFLGSSKDAFSLKLLAANRIPVVVDVSAQMLSPAVENGLKTEPFHPGNDTPILAGGKKPDLSGLGLPPEYENMTAEEILKVIIEDGGLDSGGAGTYGKGRSGRDWLPILIAIGVIAAGSTSGNNGGATSGSSSVADFGC